MTNPYPEPTNPLPWTYENVPDSLCHGDAVYLVRAANSFPALVEALEAVVVFIDHFGNQDDHDLIFRALAIARGEQP